MTQNEKAWLNLFLAVEDLEKIKIKKNKLLYY